MFTKADYERYFNMVAEKEKAMVDALKNLTAELSDPDLLEKLSGLLKEELEHNRQVRELIDRVMNPPSEARVSEREHVLGKIRLAGKPGDTAITGHCLDVSLGGMCAQSSVDLVPGTAYDMQVQFYDSGTTLSHRAVVTWSRQEGPNRYRAGLRYEETD